MLARGARPRSAPVSHTVVFLGPTLPIERARAVLHADYRPPAQKGDIYRLLTSGVDRIVVIDGLFHGQPSIWQREILSALDEGIEVLGASSMGALRAAELHPFGMKGYGTVFHWYRDGIIDADDEVALRHASVEFGYRALSEPLVNIRCTLLQAAAAQVISCEEATVLIDFARQLQYPDRSYLALLAAPLVTGWPAARLDLLREQLAQHAVNIKAIDAEGLLGRCAREPTAHAPRSGDLVDPFNAAYRSTSLRYRVLPGKGESLPWAELRRGVEASPALAQLTTKRVRARWFMLDLARLRGWFPPAEYVAAFESRWRLAQHVGDGAGWARARGLTHRELTELLAEQTWASWLTEVGTAALGLEPEVVDLDALALPCGPEVPLAAGVRALVLAWAREQGIRLPRAERSAALLRSGLADPAERMAAAQALGLGASALLRVLTARALVDWVMREGPRRFGRAFEERRAVVQELQLTESTEALLALAREGRAS